jgi:ATP-dependent HslUV protease ATP-binding subunit HslU
MTPQEIVSELDRHIVGQHQAKARRVAIRPAQPLAPLSRSRRSCAPRITPKNILMIRPDRRRQDRDRGRLAKLADAPLSRWVGHQTVSPRWATWARDVDSIRAADLAEMAGV